MTKGMGIVLKHYFQINGGGIYFLSSNSKIITSEKVAAEFDIVPLLHTASFKTYWHS